MTVLILYVEMPPAYDQKGLLNTASAFIENYEVSKKGGGGINVWLSLERIRNIDLRLKGMRLRQYIVVMGFYFFDYLSTLVHIKTPNQESIMIPRFFMEFFNHIFIGLTTFLSVSL